jgi:hypothetical protein
MAGGSKLRVAAQSRRPKTDGLLMAEAWVGRSGGLVAREAGRP